MRDCCLRRCKGSIGGKNGLVNEEAEVFSIFRQEMMIAFKIKIQPVAPEQIMVGNMFL